MSRIAFVDHRNANAARRVVIRVDMNVITEMIAETRQFEGDLFTVEAGVR